MQPEGFHLLVQQAQNGDRTAMDRVLLLLRPHLEMAARKYSDPTRAAESVSDLLQEVQLRAWQKFDQFRGGNNDEQTLALVKGWFNQIVQSLGLNARRKARTQRRQPPTPIVPLTPNPRSGESTSGGCGLEPAANQPSPSTNVRGEEQLALVRAALAKISDITDRELLRLRFSEGVSLKQAAALLNISYDTARERYQRLLQHLQGELKSLL